MAASTIRITGLNEVVRAFNKLDRSLTKEVQKGLKEAAEPVAEAFRTEVSQFRGASVSTIKSVARGASVFVRQNARKVTGKRGDFGRKQQQLAEEALDRNEAKVLKGVENALDRLTRSAGF